MERLGMAPEDLSSSTQEPDGLVLDLSHEDGLPEEPDEEDEEVVVTPPSFVRPVDADDRLEAAIRVTREGMEYVYNNSVLRLREAHNAEVERLRAELDSYEKAVPWWANPWVMIGLAVGGSLALVGLMTVVGVIIAAWSAAA